MKIILFEDAGFSNLLPLTYWRGVFDLRCGDRSLLNHVRVHLPRAELSLLVRDELHDIVAERSGLAVNTPPDADDVILLNGRLLLRGPLPDIPLSSACWSGETLVWARVDRNTALQFTSQVALQPAATRTLLGSLPGIPDDLLHSVLIRYPWDLVHINEEMIIDAWRRRGGCRIDGHVYDGAHLLDVKNICIGRGSRIKPGVTLDAEYGPILIGENVTISPNAAIIGPCIIDDGSIVQIGAAIGESSIGPVCKVGGEIEATIMQGYSNKQHDGFLGHAYIGEFVNLAADTVNSDLKNTYSSVRVPINGKDVDSGQMFVGLTMADHAKTGINQLFSTGSVVGFGSSIAMAAFAAKFTPSFRFITDCSDEPYDVERCIAVAKKAMARRKKTLTAAEETLFRKLPSIAAGYEKPDD